MHPNRIHPQLVTGHNQTQIQTHALIYGANSNQNNMERSTTTRYSQVLYSQPQALHPPHQAQQVDPSLTASKQKMQTGVTEFSQQNSTGANSNVSVSGQALSG